MTPTLVTMNFMSSLKTSIYYVSMFSWMIFFKFKVPNDNYFEKKRTITERSTIAERTLKALNVFLMNNERKTSER